MKGVLGLVQPLKGYYIRKDIRRVARWLDAPYAPGGTAALPTWRPAAPSG